MYFKRISRSNIYLFSDQATDNFDLYMMHTRHLVLLDNPHCIRESLAIRGILAINAFSVDYLGNPITLGLQPGSDGTFTLIFQYVNDMVYGLCIVFT